GGAGLGRVPQQVPPRAFGFGFDLGLASALHRVELAVVIFVNERQVVLLDVSHRLVTAVGREPVGSPRPATAGTRHTRPRCGLARPWPRWSRGFRSGGVHGGARGWVQG